MNKVVLIGRMTKDADLTFAANSGTAICKFSLAIARPFKKGETDFLNCIAFGKTGETIAQYFPKGKMIALTGNIRTGSYDAKDGTKRYTTDIVVESFEFVEGKGNSNSNNSNSNNEYNGNIGEQWVGEPVDDGVMPF